MRLAGSVVTLQVTLAGLTLIRTRRGAARPRVGGHAFQQSRGAKNINTVAGAIGVRRRQTLCFLIGKATGIRATAASGEGLTGGRFEGPGTEVALGNATARWAHVVAVRTLQAGLAAVDQPRQLRRTSLVELRRLKSRANYGFARWTHELRDQHGTVKMTHAAMFLIECRLV